MPHLLIIDDEEPLRRMLKTAFERKGYTVDAAGDGVQGLRLMRERPAELVITDLIMPDKEGLETIRELKQEYPGVPIIAVSGGGRIHPGDYLSIAGRMGAARTFQKPLELKDLFGAVEELLAGA